MEVPRLVLVRDFDAHRIGDGSGAGGGKEQRGAERD